MSTTTIEKVERRVLNPFAWLFLLQNENQMKDDLDNLVMKVTELQAEIMVIKREVCYRLLAIFPFYLWRCVDM